MRCLWWGNKEQRKTKEIQRRGEVLDVKREEMEGYKEDFDRCGNIIKGEITRPQTLRYCSLSSNGLLAFNKVQTLRINQQ